MPKKTILLLLFLTVLVTVKAQDASADTLVWTVNNAVNQANNQSFVYACTFRNYSNTKLDWSQSNGGFVIHFNVTSVDGTWADVTQDGGITFNVEDGEISGAITFTRASGVTTAHLVIVAGGKTDQDYVFAVSSVSPAQ